MEEKNLLGLKKSYYRTIIFEIYPGDVIHGASKVKK